MRRLDRRAGFTLVELMVSVALVSTLAVVLVTLEVRTHQFSSWMTRHADVAAETRYAAETIRIELRQAAASSLSPMPAASVSYRIPVDADGNGIALDRSGQIELSEPRVICRDVDDLNEDGFTDSQLIVNDAGRVRVLANYIQPDEDANGNGQLDEGEDANGNGRLDRGFWVTNDSGTLTVHVQSAFRRGPVRPAYAESRVLVTPRN